MAHASQSQPYTRGEIEFLQAQLELFPEPPSPPDLPPHVTVHNIDFADFVRSRQPMLCDYCINLATIFSDPSKTQRGELKASVSNITHHNLLSLFQSSRSCALCPLIVAAIPHYKQDLRWIAFQTMMDLLQVEYSHSAQTKKRLFKRRPGRDEWVKQAAKEWIIHLRNPAGSSVQSVARFSRLAGEYYREAARLQALGVDFSSIENIPGVLFNVGSAARAFSGIGIFSSLIGVRENFATRTQIAELSIHHIANNSGTLRVCSEADSFTSNLATGRLLPAHGSSLSTFQLAKDWVDACFHDHPECQLSSNSNDPPFPTRIIDVLTPDKNSVMLVMPKGQHGKWAALSHRWGIGSITTLRENTSNTLKSGISTSSLPATFQDAIKLTRFLGLRYLWIDSLCIIQDSVIDWQTESAAMPGIYQNAFVTIAAASTKDSHGGIFVERAWAKRSMPCILPVKSPNNEGTVTIDLSLTHGLENEEMNYLNSRAWCFQEARLSHRLLTFDRIQMSYTCLTHGLLESRELPEGARREEKNTFLPRLRVAQAKDDQTKALELVSTWYQAVADYTSRDLTFPQDRLVAIAGMARILGGFMEDKYSAGLWHKTLPQALLWSPYEEETFPHPPHKSSLPSAYRAPSWSWASVEGPISNFICRQTFGRKVHTQILEISTELQGSDPYGQVKAGSLKVRGPLQQVVCGKDSSRWPFQPNLLPFDYPLDYTSLSESEPSVLEEDSRIGHAIFDIEWLKKGSKLWVLRITDVYGLMLVAVKEDSLDVFSRIGVCHFASTVRAKNIVSIEIV